MTVTRVQAETVRETAAGTGSFAAPQQVEIRAEVAGLIRELHFQEGAWVAEGDLLIRIDDAELQRRHAAQQAALDAARADLDNAEWNLDRIRRLREQGVAAVEELKDARDRFRALSAQVSQMAAEVQLIEEQLADTRIRAPLAGRVTEHLVDVGDFVDVADRLTTLYSIDPIELRFRLPERYAGRVATGQTVAATSTAYPEQSFTGTVSFVSPVVDRQTREFEVKAELPNPDGRLKPGVFASAEVILATREQQPVVAEECLVSRRTGYSVFVVEDGVARERNVSIGVRMPGTVEIRDGLRVGEQVVRTGHMRLRDGDAVQLVSQDSADGPATQPSSTQPSSTQPASTQPGKGRP